jgi:Uncharacterised nucleotidyltransferase
MQASSLPNEAETLLLRAAFLEREPAIAAYKIWRERLDLDALNLGSQRVMALLYRNLRAHGVDDPLMGRLRGVTRYAWFSNRNLIAAVKPVFRKLDESRIPFVLLKGMALVASLPEQMKLRPMGDVDILVRPDQVSAAIDALSSCGWWAYYGTCDLAKQLMARGLESFGFERGPHLYFDLHSHMLNLCRWPEADAMVWQRTRTAAIGDIGCKVPCFEDQVLHACVHGAPWSPTGALRWAADSVVILRATGHEFDWDYLLNQAEDRKVIVPLRHGLEYLRAKLDVPIPTSVLKRLRAIPVSIVARADYRLRASNQTTLQQWQEKFLEFQNFRRSQQRWADDRNPEALCAWIRSLWATDTCAAALAASLFGRIGHPAWLRTWALRRWPVNNRLSLLRSAGLPSVRDGVIAFSSARPSMAGPLYGFSLPEKDGRWTDAPEAALAFRTDRCDEDLEVRFSLCAMATPKTAPLGVEVWANKHHVADWTFQVFESGSPCHLGLPADILRGEFLVLTFVIRSPRSPKSLGLSTDPRPLGLFFRNVEFSPSRESGGHQISEASP